ncbi:MAG: hypothetical protein ACK5NN_05975 [Sphingomonadaceae bacterium]
MRRNLVLAVFALLGACTGSGSSQTGVKSASSASTGQVTRPVSRAVPPTRPTSHQPGAFRPARVMNAAGLESVIGADVAGLERQFGKARLDVWEGDARKLQFTGDACVLDIYLYPAKQGAEPQATYVDARRASDGLDVDRIACINALKR